jgi:hypothetical protein
MWVRVPQCNGKRSLTVRLPVDSAGGRLAARVGWGCGPQGLLPQLAANVWKDSSLHAVKAGDPVISWRCMSQVYLGRALPHCQLTEGKCDVMADCLQACGS